jgi:hypothetical protein
MYTSTYVPKDIQDQFDSEIKSLKSELLGNFLDAEGHTTRQNLNKIREKIELSQCYWECLATGKTTIEPIVSPIRTKKIYDKVSFEFFNRKVFGYQESLMLCGYTDPGSSLSLIPIEIILHILQIKSHFESPTYEDFKTKFLTPPPPSEPSGYNFLFPIFDFTAIESQEKNDCEEEQEVSSCCGLFS